MYGVILSKSSSLLSIRGDLLRVLLPGIITVLNSKVINIITIELVVTLLNLLNKFIAKNSKKILVCLN